MNKEKPTINIEPEHIISVKPLTRKEAHQMVDEADDIRIMEAWKKDVGNIKVLVCGKDKNYTGIYYAKKVSETPQ